MLEKAKISLYCSTIFESTGKSMSKISRLEDDYNDILSKQEFILNFEGDHEIVITGAPKKNFLIRGLISLVGVAIVTACLIVGQQANSTFAIGGSLLGLMIAATPFISFYSKKHFKIHISKTLRTVKIYSNIFSPYQRIDFSEITGFTLDRVEAEDFMIDMESNPLGFQYTFIINQGNKSTNLFSLSAYDQSLDKFVENFSILLSEFIQTEFKSSFHHQALPVV